MQDNGKVTHVQALEYFLLFIIFPTPDLWLSPISWGRLWSFISSLHGEQNRLTRKDELTYTSFSYFNSSLIH